MTYDFFLLSDDQFDPLVFHDTCAIENMISVAVDGICNIH